MGSPAGNTVAAAAAAAAEDNNRLDIAVAADRQSPEIVEGTRSSVKKGKTETSKERNGYNAVRFWALNAK